MTDMDIPTTPMAVITMTTITTITTTIMITTDPIVLTGQIARIVPSGPIALVRNR
jgi:hypothetical protein